MSWEESFQRWGDVVVGGWASKEFAQPAVQPPTQQGLQLQAVGQGGVYREGQPGAVTQTGGMGGLGLLLVGAAVVAFIVLKR